MFYLIRCFILGLISVTPSLEFTQHCHQGTGRCYWISDTAEGNWAEGRAACQSEGGDLAVMETEELYNYVKSVVR